MIQLQVIHIPPFSTLTCVCHSYILGWHRTPTCTNNYQLIVSVIVFFISSYTSCYIKWKFRFLSLFALLCFLLISRRYILKSVNFFGDFLGRWTRAGGRVTLVSARKQLENAISSGEKSIQIAIIPFIFLFFVLSRLYFSIVKRDCWIGRPEDRRVNDNSCKHNMATYKCFCCSEGLYWRYEIKRNEERKEEVIIDVDIILYLNTTFYYTEPLSVQLREEIATRAFKRVGDAILGMLLGVSSLFFTPFSFLFYLSFSSPFIISFFPLFCWLLNRNPRRAIQEI